jgi:2-methylcitrate dehydratase PrpD
MFCASSGGVGGMEDICVKDGATSRLAKFISTLQFEDLPQATVEKAKETILDYLGALLAGYIRGSRLSESLTELLINNGGAQEATFIGPNVKVPVINAALGNGVLSHVVELDDGHRIARGHPGVTVISSALAAAEYLQAGGKELITAIVAGYDVFVRVASAVNPSHLERGFHTTGTCGTLAAAAAAAKLFALNPEETDNALGLAGIQAAGLLEVTIDGQMAKPLHAGKAAQAGVLAALLARDGARGPRSVIEGKKGFARAMADAWEPELLCKGLGEVFHIDNSYVKLYPSCRHTHSPVDAVLALRKEYNFSPSDVDSILIKIYPTAISFAGEIYKPKTPEEAKFSIPYCACAALVKGRYGLRELEADCLHDGTIQALTERVVIEPDPSLESLQPKRKGAEVHITLKDGRKLEKRIDLPRGEVENPVSREELIMKFENCVEDYFAEETRERVINRVFGIDELDDIRALIAMF